MALEEVGTKLVVQGEKAFVDAMNKATKSVASTGDAASKQSSGFGKLSSSFEKLTGFSLASTLSLAGLGMAIGAAAGYAKQAITDASDLNETMSKSSVVFGDSAAKIEAFGSTSATALGMSKNAAIGAAATFGNLFVSMGMTKPAAADMSTSLITLATDLGSFNNLASSDVLEKLRAGLTGETEPLKALGININAAAVQAKAMEMGLIGLDGQLSTVGKTQATYALIMEQTVTAQGDFSRTSDGAANQTKILEAKMADLSANIGGQLLPAYVALLGAMNQVASAFAQAFEIATGFKSTLAQHEKEVRKTSSTYKEYAVEMIRAKNAANQNNITIEEATKIYETYEKAGLDLADSEYAVGTAEYYKGKAIDESKKMVEGYTAIQAAQTKKTTEAAFAAEHAGDAYTAMAAAFKKNQEEMAKQQALQAAKDKADALAAAFGELTTQMLYNTAAEGLNTEGKLQLARQMGLIDEHTYDAVTAQQALKAQYEAGQFSLEEYTTMSAQLAVNLGLIQSKDVTIKVSYVTEGDPGVYKVPAKTPQGKPKATANAVGGDYMVNRPTTFLAGEAGPERAIFIPQGKSIFDIIKGALPGMGQMSAGPTSYSTSYQNNYNLNLSTSQSPQVVQQSFSIMRMLAG